MEDAQPSSSGGHASLPPLLPGGGPAAQMVLPRVTYLRKNSFLYLFCSAALFIAVMRLVVYDFTLIGFQHHQALSSNLREPWALFRWMGSVGVDVTDKQWYFFIVALPPAFPVIILFLIISRHLRRTSDHVALSGYYGGALGGGGSSSSNNTTNNRRSSVSRNEQLHTSVVVMSADKGSTAVDAAVNDLGKHAASSMPLDRVLVGKNLTNLYLLHIVFGVIIAVGISGPAFAFGLLLMVLNYFCIVRLRHRCSFKVCMTVMWITHVAVLFLNFHMDGYRFQWFGLSFLDHLYSPLIRWTVHYNMAVLRMIAFSNDYWESLENGEDIGTKAILKHERSCVACAVIRDENGRKGPVGSISSSGGGPPCPPEALQCYKCRTECPRPVSEYTFLSYMGYMMYPPLMIAGPMSSFNAYAAHLHNPTRALSRRALVKYIVRFLGNAFVLSAMMHFIFIPAILFTPPTAAALQQSSMGKPVPLGGDDGGGGAEFVDTFAMGGSNLTGMAAAAAAGVNATVTVLVPHNVAAMSVFDQLPPTTRAVGMFLILAFLWAKFNVIWKFFRLFALLDGVEPPEDMPRCFANTVNIQGFWRDWHASFNLWIVRYMYIPMGGNKTKMFSIFPIFFFIAIWHDIELRLLFWALFICVFFVPEVIITAFFGSRHPYAVAVKKRVLLWRYLRVVGAGTGMILLVFVNLVGFSMGLSGAESKMSTILSEMSWYFVFTTPFLFMCGAVVAIQDRDEKAHINQVMKVKYGLLAR